MKVNMPLEIAEDFGRVPPIKRKQRHDSPPEAAVRPILLLLVGTSGSGRTTFYETPLETAFPTLLRDSASPVEQKEADEENCPFSRTRACEAVANDTKVGARGVREGSSIGG